MQQEMFTSLIICCNSGKRSASCKFAQQSLINLVIASKRMSNSGVLYVRVVLDGRNVRQLQ